MTNQSRITTSTNLFSATMPNTSSNSSMTPTMAASDNDLSAFDVVTSAPMDPILVQQFAAWLDPIQLIIQDFFDFFLQSPFSKDSIHRLSIILLLLERIQRPFLEMTTTVSQSSSLTAHTAFHNNNNNTMSETYHFPLLLHNRESYGTTSSMSNRQGLAAEEFALLLVTLSVYFVSKTCVTPAGSFTWPPFLLWMSSSSSSQYNYYNNNSFFTSSAIHQEFIIVMTIIFSIICLESFLPMILWVVTSLFLFRSICWETTLSILVLVWFGGTIGPNLCKVGVQQLIHESFQIHS